MAAHAQAKEGLGWYVSEAELRSAEGGALHGLNPSQPIYRDEQRRQAGWIGV
jgi:hypothetical protein